MSSGEVYFEAFPCFCADILLLHSLLSSLNMPALKTKFDAAEIICSGEYRVDQAAEYSIASYI